MMERIKCDGCGKYFTPGNKADGCPNGLGFVLKTGEVISYCYDCLCAIGRKAQEKEEQK